MLSKIETAKAAPSVATLMRIAAALGTTAAALLEPTTDGGTIFTPADRTTGPAMQRSDAGYRFVTVAAQRDHKLVQPFIFEAAAGQRSPRGRAQPLMHAGEEFVFVLNGRMRYRVGPTQYTLGPGDSLYFDAEQEHELWPLTKTVRFLAVFTEAPAARPPGRRATGKGDSTPSRGKGA
jgi:quercetin dioxygenase-like cupin family protein